MNFRPHQKTSRTPFRIIVVGGGSACCVMASRLSEDASCSVLLLEAGRAYTPDTYPDALKDISGNTVEPQYICAQRAADGHPAPFPLQFVEVGNEDYFDPTLSYAGRFPQFFDAIKAAYHNLKVFSTTRLPVPLARPT